MTTLYLWGKPIVPLPPSDSASSCLSLHHTSPFHSISCGDTHCLLSTEEGVYGVGDNSEGQLGLGTTIRNTGMQLIKLEIGSKKGVKMVSCGWNYSLVLDRQGRVYSAGKGDSGELGRGKVRNSLSFGLVLEGVSQISAGKDHSLALVGSKVFGWGNSR